MSAHDFDDDYWTVPLRNWVDANRSRLAKRPADDIALGAVTAVAPLIEAQARERALREAAKDTETFIIPYGVRRPTQFMMGQTTAAEQIRGAILNRIGAPQQSASTGANSATAENADQKTEAPSDGW